MKRAFALLAGLLVAVGIPVADGARAQQDYSAKGLSVYAPRPVPAVFGSVSAAASTLAGPAAPIATADGQVVRAAAQRMLSDGAPRWLTVRNANTGGTVTAEFWHDGSYDAWEMARVIQLLGDHREREAAAIDRRLVDLIWILARLSGRTEVTVTSGYRSGHTNVHLASTNANVASDSLHMSGRALDIALPGVPVDVVARHAVGLAWGGVGKYRADGHVHVDVGSFRYWAQ